MWDSLGSPFRTLHLTKPVSQGTNPVIQGTNQDLRCIRDLMVNKQGKEQPKKLEYKHLEGLPCILILVEKGGPHGQTESGGRVLAVNAGARAPRGGVTRQGVVLTDLQSLCDCQLNFSLSLSLSRARALSQSGVYKERRSSPALYHSQSKGSMVS